MSINNKLLGRAIRSVRTLRGLTQAELGRKARMAPNSIAILERGERGFTAKNLNLIADALRIPAACLTVLGSSSPGKRDPLAAQLLEKTQQLILASLKLGAEKSSKPRKASA
jgi:transcriptional regulator with XRE-family HTH domain